MATVSLIGSDQTTTDNTAVTAASTPANGDLVFAFAVVSDQAAGGTFSDNMSLGWTQVELALFNTSADSVVCAVSNALSDGSATNVTFTPAGGPTSTTVNLHVYGVAGVTRVGLDAVLQTAKQENQAAATPAPVFSSSALTGNPTLGVAGNKNNPASLTEPSGWTLGLDAGRPGPATGINTVFRNSGFTGTTITWGSASATDFASVIVELDATTPTINSYSGSGGIQLGGTAELARTRDFLPSGGAQFAGTAPVSKTKDFPVSGGIALAGSASLSKTKIPRSPTNGIVFESGVALSKTKDYTPSGGVSLTGAAGTARISLFSPSVSGGLTLAGVGPVSKTKVPSASGGIGLAGDGLPNKTKAGPASGGALLAGAASTQIVSVTIESYTPSSGMALAGNATLAKTKAFLPSGGLVLASSGSPDFVPIVEWSDNEEMSYKVPDRVFDFSVPVRTTVFYPVEE